MNRLVPYTFERLKRAEIFLLDKIHHELDTIILHKQLLTLSAERKN